MGYSAQGSVVVRKIRKGKDGRDAVRFYLTVSPQFFTLDSHGAIVETNKKVKVQVWKAIGSAIPAKASDGEVYMTIIATNKAGDTTSIKADSVSSAEFTASKAYISYLITIYDGSAKTNEWDSFEVKIGKNGENVVRLDLDNENDSILYDGAGNKLSDNVVTNATLWDGATAYTGSPVTFLIPDGGKTNCEASITGNKVTVTKLTDTTAQVLIHAKYTIDGVEKVYEAVFSIKKLVGVDKYDIVVSPNAVSYNTSTASVQSGGSIEVRVYRTPANGGARTNVTKLSDYGLSLECSPNLIGAYASGKATVTVSDDNARDNANIVLTLKKGDAVQDSDTIPVLKARDGKDTVRLDLDNQMAGVPCNADGKVLRAVSISTNVRVYEGGTLVNDYTEPSKPTITVTRNGEATAITPTLSKSNKVTKLTWSFEKDDILASASLELQITTTYKDSLSATFSVIRNDGPIVYQLHPSLNEMIFSRTSDTDNTLTPASYALTCGYTKTDGETTVIGTEVSNIGGKYNIYYRYVKADGTKTSWYRLSNATNSTVTITSATSYKGIEWGLGSSNTDASMIDLELVPVVKGGLNARSPFLLDLTNENTQVNCDYNGTPLSGAKYETSKVQLRYGTQDAYSWFDITVAADGITDGWTSSERMLKPSAITKDTATITVTATGKADTLASGTVLSVVMTITKNKPGRPGETPVMYSLITSHGVIHKNKDGGFIDTTMTLKVLKVEGTTETLLDTYKKLADAGVELYCAGNSNKINSNTTSGASVTITCSDYFDADHKEFVAVVNEVEVDREGVDCVSDGQTGPTGPKGDSYVIKVTKCDIKFLTNSRKVYYSEIIGDAYKIVNGELVGIDLTNAANWVQIRYNGTSFVKITYTANANGHFDDDDEQYESGGVDYRGDLAEKTLNRDYISIDLYVGSVLVHTHDIPIMLPGTAGYSYKPIDMGIFDPNTTYSWGIGYRHFVDYDPDGNGVYYKYAVKTVGDSFSGVVPEMNGVVNSRWEKGQKVEGFITANTFFGTNANIGGFITTNQRFLSSSVAYLIRYLGNFNENTAYEYVTPNDYNGLNAPRLDMVLYNSEYWVPKFQCQFVYRYMGTYSAYTTYEYVYPSAENGLSVSRIDIVYYNSKFWILKSGGTCYGQTPSSSSDYWREASTEEKYQIETPSATSNFWRKATADERALAENGINSVSPLYKLELLGLDGTIKLLHENGYKWEVTKEGVQILGVDSGRHIEIDPSAREVRIYDDDGNQSVTFNGETISNMDNLYATSAPSISITSASSSSYGVGYTGNTSGYAQKEEWTAISNSFTLASSGKLTLTGSIAAKSNRQMIAEGSSMNTTIPQIMSSQEAPYYSGGYWYINNVAYIHIVVKRTDGREYYVGAGAYSDGMSNWKTTNINSTIVLEKGTYKIYVKAEYRLQEGTSNNAYVKWTNIAQTFLYDFYQSKIFSNGLTFGSSAKNFFAVMRESGGNMRIKTLTNNGKEGFELDATNGLRATRNSITGIIYPTILFAYVKWTARETFSLVTQKSFDGSSCTILRTTEHSDDGEIKLTFPQSIKNLNLSPSNCIINVTAINNISTSTSNKTINAHVYRLTNEYIQIEGNDDTSNNYTSFHLEIKYIG